MKAFIYQMQEQFYIGLQFAYDPIVSRKLRCIKGVFWNESESKWMLPIAEQALDQLFSTFPHLEYDDSFMDKVRQKLGPSHKTLSTMNYKIFVSRINVEKKQYFKLDPNSQFELIDCLKKMEGIIFEPEVDCWLIRNSRENLKLIFSHFSRKAYVDVIDVFKKSNKAIREKKKIESDKPELALLSDENQEHINQFINFLNSSRYSQNTIKTYSDGLRIFFRYLNNKPLADISNLDLIDFNNNYILRYNYSASFQNQVINAIKLYFKKIENRKLIIDSIERPRREKKLPNVLSRQEIESILKAAAPNIKHKAMLSLIYSCGLRRGELLNLKSTDIKSDRGILNIRNAKGKKDRITPLSSKVVELLREYYIKYRTKVFLFEGDKPGTKYSERSLEEVMKKYVNLAGINKPVTLHWLRHSFATHLLESGTDIRYIQEILGHKSSKTTEIYTHVSTKYIQQIKSPFDDLDL